MNDRMGTAVEGQQTKVPGTGFAAVPGLKGGQDVGMELLDGVDADRLVRRFGPLPPERVVHVLRQMCHSLSEAESCGLVHRDIKPANIFLCRYGEDHDFVKVLDFGIAKVAHDTSPDAETMMTIPNVIQGTPAFIAASSSTRLST